MTFSYTWHWNWPEPGLSFGFKWRNRWHDPFDRYVWVWLMVGPGWFVFRCNRGAP